MAEEVKIVDVAGGPAAEATLQELLKVMKGKAGGGSGGGSTESASKAQDLYTSAVTRGTKSRKANTKAVDNSTSALKKMANFASGMVSGTLGMFTKVIGGAIGVATNLVKAFGDGTGTLTDMVNAIPGIGSILGMFTGYLDNTLTVFQQLSSSGASFNNNLTLLRTSAANAKVSLESFASLIGNNTESLAMFGGTVTQGAKVFGDARKAMNKYETDLLNMGYTFEEINEGLMDYMALNSAGARAGQRDQAVTAQNAAEYAKTLKTLSKLTGEDVKAIRERQQKQSNDLAFQMKLGKMTEEERAKTLKGLADAEAAGPAAVARFKEEVMGFPPMTRETQLFAATMGKANQAIVDRARAVKDESVSMKAFSEGSAASQARMLAGMLESAEQMETVLTAGSLSGEGIGNELLSILQASGVNLNKYIGMAGQELEAAIQEDIIKAQEENKKRDEAAEGLLAFQQTLRNIKKDFETYLVAPLTKTMGPAINSVGSLLKGWSEGDGKQVFADINAIFSNFTDTIGQFGFSTAMTNLFDDLSGAIGPMMGGLMDDIKAFLFGQSAEEVKAEMAGHQAALEAGRANMQAEYDKLLNDVNSGAITGPESAAARERMAALTLQMEQTKTRIAEVGEEMKTAEGSTGLLGGVMGGLWETVSNMDWGTAALALGGMTAAIVALGFAAKPVVVPLIAIGAAAAGIGLAAGGIADLINSITNSVSNLADGVKKFEDMDSGKLFDVGSALGPLTENIMELAKGGIVASFVSEGALEGLANGVRAFGDLDASNLWPIGLAIKGLGDPIKEIATAGFFANFVSDGALEGLASGVRAFEGLDVAGLTATGPALQSLQAGIAAFTGDGVLDSAGKAVGGFISSLFGDGEGQFDALIGGLKKFEEVNADAIHKVGTGLQGLNEFATSDIDLGQINISSAGLERLNEVTKSLDSNAITKYNEALEKLVDVLSDLNEELGTNPGEAGATGGAAGGPTSAAGALESMSGGGSSEEMQRNRMVLMQILEELRTANKYNKRTAAGVSGDLQAGF